MDRRKFIAAAGIAAWVASTSVAFARFRGGAYLDHAVPGVGLTVSGPVRELRLYFMIDVLPGFSSVEVINSRGARVPTSRPFSDPADPSVVIFKFGRALPPDTYGVRWQVVSVHRRPSWGTFHFTIS